MKDRLDAGLAKGKTNSKMVREITLAARNAALPLSLGWFGRHERYRAFGDGVFVLPVIVLLAG